MSSKILKILYVITSLRTGGAERLVTEISQVLIQEGHFIEVLVFDGISSPLLKELEESGVKIYKGWRGFYQMYNPINILRIKRLAKKNHYDLIHSHNTSAQYFVGISGVAKYSKLVTTEHNTTNRRRKWYIYKFIDRFIYNKYDSIISVSNEVKRNLQEYLSVKIESKTGNAKFQVIYNGIDLSKFQSIGKHQTDSPIILMISAFRKQKDHATTIRAMLHLPEQYKLWFAGDGKTKKECEKLVRNLNLNGRIKFLGNVNDIPSLISQAKIVILSTNFEGMPFSAIEAMASGKPFIGSDVVGMREIAADAAILFQKGNEIDLANKIENLINSPEEYEMVAKNCRKRALNFDLSHTVNQHLRLYNQLISCDIKDIFWTSDNYEK